MTDDNRALHDKVIDQHNTITSLSNDIKKQKDTLHHENIKLAKSLASTEKQRDSLVRQEKELQEKVEKLEKKMAKVGFGIHC